MKSEENEKIVKILTILRNMQDVVQTSVFRKKNLAFLQQIYYNNPASTVPQQIKF